MSEVEDSDNNFIAYGYYNSKSQISVRLLEWDEKTAIDDDWWREKLDASIARRERLISNSGTDSYRLVYSESDMLPGLIVDRYGEYIVIQILSSGIERVKDIIVSHLEKSLSPTGIYERSDVDVRKLEGLGQHKGLLAGSEPPEYITINENNHQFKVNIKSGQKTGFYLDQRDNRQAAAEFANGRDILDCFCHSGAFSVYALANGAKSATLLDSSAASLAIANENIKLNKLDQPVEYICGDVFNTLRQMKDDGRKFDMIILDPPKFAPTKNDLKKALSAYKDINMSAMNILNPNGILATFSCSGAVDSQTLQTVLFWASTDAGKEIQVIRKLSQGIDHPVRVSFPESEYLKGYICRVM